MWSSETRFRGRIFLAVFSALFVLTSPTRGAAPPQEAYSRLYFAIQPPQNREVERSVELIEELLETGRHGEAAPLIDRFFSAEVDYLDSQGVSLRRRLHGAVLAAEPQGRRILRSILAGAYRRELGEANTVERLRKIVTRYPPDLFGGEALTALARSEEAAGAYATAAAAWAYAERVARKEGRHAEADRHADASSASALRGGQRITGSLDEAERLALRGAREANASQHAPESWLGPAGDARRRAWGGGEAPTGWRAWWAPVEPFASIPERRLATPTGGLIATQGLLLTPTPSGLIAFSAESGKRLWQAGESPHARARGGSASYERARGGIASDGRLAFVVEPTHQSDAHRNAREQALLFAGSRSRTMQANALVAYDLSREGKLAWRWDGGNDPTGRDKASLLGPPAVAETRLYVLAQIDQSVCLVTLDAGSGERLASQPLVRCERGYPPHAITVGVSPTVGDRLVYCPTGRGAVAAYDPLLRRLEWVHYLRVDKDQATPHRRNAWNGLGRGGQDDRDAWKHCHVILRDGRLVIASPALATLETLDAASGELLWREPVEAGRLLAGVEAGRVVTLEQAAVVARDLDTGDTTWRVDLPEGDSPTGEAVWLDTGCLVPLSSGSLAQVAEGKLDLIPLGLNPLQRPAALGDLIVHRGAVYSRSHAAIACYRQPTNAPDNAPTSAALRDLIAGDATRAADRLRDALRQRPDDKRIAERLAAALLRAEGLSLADAEELGRLVSGPKGAAYASFFQIEAARTQGDEQATHAIATALLGGHAADEALGIEPGLWVRAGRLAEDRLGRFAPPPADEPANPNGLSTPGWSSVQIEAAAKIIPQDPTAPSRPSRRREPESVTQALAFPNEPIDDGPLAHWVVEFRSGEPTRLIGHNRWGERAFLAEAPSESSARGRRQQQTVGLPSDARHGEWIALRLDDGYAVYHHTAKGPNQEPALAWASRSVVDDGFEPNAGANLPEKLYAAGPWGLISVSAGRVVCRDLATGRLQWRRRVEALQDKAPRLLVSGDDLLVAGANDRGTRLAAATGELRSEPWLHPPVKGWRSVTTSLDGTAHLLIERRLSGGREYRLVSADRPDKPLWVSQPMPHTLTATTRNGFFALLSEESRLTLLDMKQGEERFSVQLPTDDERPVREIRIVARRGRLLVEVDRTNPMIDRAIGFSGLTGSPMLTGELHCLDPDSGESLWAGPAEIEALASLPIPFDDAPVILYGRRTTQESDSSGAEPRLSLVALDSETGGALYRNHQIPAGKGSQPANRFRVQSEVDGRLLIRLGRLWLTLKATDRPAPPRPPMMARVEDPATAKPKDVGRSVERLINSFWDDR